MYDACTYRFLRRVGRVVAQKISFAVHQISFSRIIN